MKYLIYSILFLTLLARADELVPEATEVETVSPVETAAPSAETAPASEAKPQEAALTDPTPPATGFDNPAPALPPSDQPSIATSTSTETAPLPVVEAPASVPADAAAPAPVDATANLAVPPPVAVETPNYGPSAEEGYGSVGLKNDGGILEVGGDKQTEESTVEAGERKTSSVPGASEEKSP